MAESEGDTAPSGPDRRVAGRAGARRRWIVAFAVTACLLAFAASAAQAGVPRDFFGVVNQHRLDEHDLRLMQEAGVRSVRIHVAWHTIQPESGRCQPRAEWRGCRWWHQDELIGSLAAAGIEAFPFLLNSPDWIHPDPERPPLDSAADRDAWRGYLRALVKRYGHNGAYWKDEFPERFPGARPLPVRAWEIWNEPNDAPYWHPRPNARDYARLLRISGQAIHRASRRASVVLAGVFGSPRRDVGGIPAPKFYRQVLAAPRIGSAFDSVGIHPYGPQIGRVRSQVESLRREMRRAGFGDRGIRVTEIGWASDRGHKTLGKNPRRQARLLSQAMRLFRSHRREWRIRGVHWYAWQDFPGSELCAFCTGTGLVDTRGDPKPSFWAFRQTAR